jgi:serine/threonine protein kinase/Tfp pilus assembly protein PilF
MGEVFLAQDTKLNRRLALKILPAELGHDRQRIARLLREAQAASALSHPNICIIYEINDETGIPFIAMEYVEGETLAEKIKSHKFDLTETLDIALQIADALAEAHAHGIIHRDIKPANIIITQRGQVKVLDFGLAKRITAGGEAETQQLLSGAGIILGTVAYMSPEQARGLPADARTDVWSLGVVLYEMLTGARPFKGETPSDVLAAILRSEPEDLRKSQRGIPAELERIILRALRKERDDRYESARELHADLERFHKQSAATAQAGSMLTANSDANAETIIVKAETSATIAQAEERNSIAVLPFSNMSAEAENEYFCDGLAEELINSLAQIEALKVAARTSAFSFKGQNSNIKEIANTLNVKTVLEGSVRKSGSRLRITVQLINAADGYHLWSERYDREMKDIFDIQDEITLAVVDALSVKLLGSKRAAVLRRDTKDTELYQTYLKGKYFLNKRKPDEFKKAIEFFRLAVDMDPNYAPAYAGLADSYAMIAAYEVLPPHEAYPKAKAAAIKALELNDALAEAHNSLAFILHNYDWDWAAAELEYQRAIELNPSYATSHQWYALYLAYARRFDEAEATNKRALELDPLSLIINANRGLIMFTARKYEQAIIFSRKAIEMDENFYQAHADLGRAYLENGEHQKALAEMQEARRLDDDPSVLAFLGYAHAVLGDREKAEHLIRELNELSKQTFVSPFFVATIYTGLGEKDKAFEWLEKAYEARSYWLMCLNADPQFDSLRSDCRFTSLLRRTGVIAS